MRFWLWSLWRSRLLIVMLFILYLGAAAQTPPPAGGSPLDVLVLDQSHLPVPAAQVEIKYQDHIVGKLSTGQDGHAVFSLQEAGQYAISVSKAGFETTVVSDFAWGKGAPDTLELTLNVAGTTDSVEVRAEASSVETGPTPALSASVDSIKAVPSRPATVADALPLIPSVVRQPGGALQLSGTGEHRNAMIVNSADVTDPATGEFGLTVPIDIVESLNY